VAKWGGGQKIPGKWPNIIFFLADAKQKIFFRSKPPQCLIVFAKAARAPRGLYRIGYIEGHVFWGGGAFSVFFSIPGKLLLKKYLKSNFFH